MLNLSEILDETPPPVDPQMRVRRGPKNVCFPLYGEGDLTDWETVERRRSLPGRSWATAQAEIDDKLGIPRDARILNDKFRYHWSRKCSCWSDELRRS